jgi:hypothetical protein
LNKADLDSLAGTLPRQVLAKVEDGLRWFLHLET